MDAYPHATDNALQAEQKLLISTVSDEALEKAAGITSSGQPYPGTGVATICIPESPFPKKLGG
jgi:hypothetical protein